MQTNYKINFGIIILCNNGNSNFICDKLIKGDQFDIFLKEK